MRCPVLVVHGDQDGIVRLTRPAGRWRRRTGELVTILRAAGTPDGREPVSSTCSSGISPSFARALRHAAPVRRTWTEADEPAASGCFTSPRPSGSVTSAVTWPSRTSCVGSAPAWRSHWLTQHPVDRGTGANAASGCTRRRRWLASECAHIESEAGEHDLHVFQAIRRMDEILVANFMVFHDLDPNEPYDLWIGDEAWDVDHFLHENPELKRSAVRVADRLRGLAADARRRRGRGRPHRRLERRERREERGATRGCGIGPSSSATPATWSTSRSGQACRAIRDWAQENYPFSGYVSGFSPPRDRHASSRAELGYLPGERICLVTVGGSGVGAALLRRVVSAFPLAERMIPGLRMVVVTGPRIDPGSMPRCPKASKCEATSPTCTGTSPRAMWPWSKAG